MPDNLAPNLFDSLDNPWGDDYKAALNALISEVNEWIDNKDAIRDKLAEARYTPPLTRFRGIITGSASAGANKWAYTVRMAEVDEQRQWAVHSNPNALEVTAYNRVEWQNDGSAEEGLGGNVDPPAGTTIDLLPIIEDAVVEVIIEITKEGTAAYWFSESNELDVACT